MKVKVLSANELLFDAPAAEVVLPGADGEICVMDFHQSCLQALKRGQIQIKEKVRGDVKKRIYIHKGLAQVALGELWVLVETLVTEHA